MIIELLTLLVKLNIALTLGVGLVLVLRKPLRERYGSGATYRLWALVPIIMLAVTLPARTVIMPFTASEAIVPISAPESRAPFADMVMPETTRNQALPTNNAAASPLPNAPNAPNAMLILALWFAGCTAYIGILYFRQKQYDQNITPLSHSHTPHGPIWHAKTTATGPALVGLRAPRIVVPADFSERYSPTEQKLIIAHETIHLRRCDTKANALAAVLASICWINPLAHIGINRMRLDQELACDSAVLRQFPQHRRTYGEAMLKDQLNGPKSPIGCYWKSTHPLKERIIMLSSMSPNRTQRTIGSAVLAGLFTTVSALAWASQPPVVLTEPAPLQEPAQVSAPALPAARGNAVLSRTYSVNSIDIENAVAVLRVIPEARSDYFVEIAGFMPPEIRKKRNSLVIDGGLPDHNLRCTIKTAAKAQAADNGMTITIRAPMNGSISAGGIIFSEFGSMDGGDIALHGCGNAAIADTKGPMDISMHGAVRGRMGHVKGNLDLSVHGAADLVVGDVDGGLDLSLHGAGSLELGDIRGGVDASIHGSADAEAGRIFGPLDASIHGAANFNVAAVDKETEASMHGSARLTIGKQSKGVEASMHGSADLEIKTITAKYVEASLRGSADLTIGEGRVETYEISLNGSGRARFNGHAQHAIIDNDTSNTIYINSIGRLTIEDERDHRGRVKTKDGFVRSSH